MKFRYLASFDRSYRKLDPYAQRAVDAALEGLFRLYERGEKPEGLGLKKLKSSCWEIRAGLHLRILIALEGDETRFILVGNHDDVRRFLRGVR